MRFKLEFLISFSLFIFPSVVLADMGPKPTMTLNLVYEVKEPITLVKADLMQCKDALCKEATPLEDYGPQRFTCAQNLCESQSYGYAPYQKLVVEFSDRTRESNIFQAKSLRSNFKVIVKESELSVEKNDKRFWRKKRKGS